MTLPPAGPCRQEVAQHRPPALEVTGLVKRYGTRTALDGVSFTVPPGSLVALLGPNGAGKTTTVEICEGYQRPDGGTVRVLGLDPVTEAGRLRPRVGVMIQSGGVHPGARPGEALGLAAALARDPLDVGWLIDVLGLRSAVRTPFRRLSGGEQRRLCLGLAVVHRPELVFLDEPTAGLDLHARRDVHALARAMRADGVTVVLTTHLLEEAERLADHVVILDRGAVVAAGSPADLVGQVGQTSTLRFGGPAGRGLSTLQGTLPAGCTAREPAPGRYEVEGADGPDALAAVAAWCAQEGFMPTGLRTGGGTLEDVFDRLTAGGPS